MKNCFFFAKGVVIFISFGFCKLVCADNDLDLSAINFVEPIAIYSKERRKPYVVAVFRWDAPAPPPNREKINVFQWDDALDKLRKIPEKERLKILDFLHEMLCKDHPKLKSYGDAPFLLSQGDLCFPRE